MKSIFFQNISNYFNLEQCLVQNQPDLLTFKPLNWAVNNYCSCTIFSSGYDHWRPSTYELRNLHEEIRVNSPHSDSVFAQMPTPLYYKVSTTIVFLLMLIGFESITKLS